MKEQIKCLVNGFEVLITNNAVRTRNSSLQIELVKRLIECKEIAGFNKSALPLFFNKYLRFYQLSEVEFISVDSVKNMMKNETAKMNVAA